MISHKIQSEMRAILNKIYPVKVCEIRYLGIEPGERKSGEEQPEANEEANAEAETVPKEEAEVQAQ